MTACADAIERFGDDLEAAAEHLNRRRRDTADPFLGCPHGAGLGVSRRGQFFHKGCPLEHGEVRNR